MPSLYLPIQVIVLFCAMTRLCLLRLLCYLPTLVTAPAFDVVLFPFAGNGQARAIKPSIGLSISSYEAATNQAQPDVDIKKQTQKENEIRQMERSGRKRAAGYCYIKPVGINHGRRQPCAVPEQCHEKYGTFGHDTTRIIRPSAGNQEAGDHMHHAYIWAQDRLAMNRIRPIRRGRASTGQ